MATRVRTNISFGAFANLRTNLQNQIGLNTLITSIKKLISTYNNNFAYIANSFNTLMQMKYDSKYTVFTDQESSGSYYSSSSTDTDYESIINRITNIKARLDFLESGDTNKSYVNAEVMWYIKDFTKYDADSVTKYPVLTPDSKTGYSYIIATKKMKAQWIFGTRNVNAEGVMQTNATSNNFITGTAGSRYWTKDIQVMSGTSSTLEIGPVNVYLTTGVQTTIVGYGTYCLCFSGKKNGVFPTNWTELKGTSI